LGECLRRAEETEIIPSGLVPLLVVVTTPPAPGRRGGGAGDLLHQQDQIEDITGTPVQTGVSAVMIGMIAEDRGKEIMIVDGILIGGQIMRIDGTRIIMIDVAEIISKTPLQDQKPPLHLKLEAEVMEYKISSQIGARQIFKGDSFPLRTETWPLKERRFI
jgi:hypothetical protein